MFRQNRKLQEESLILSVAGMIPWVCGCIFIFLCFKRLPFLSGNDDRFEEEEEDAERKKAWYVEF